MAHPSAALPQDIYVLDASHALVVTDGKHVYAIANPTATAINATVVGSIFNYNTDGYYEITTSDIIPVQPGATIYGRFTSVTGSAADLLCYVN